MLVHTEEKPLQNLQVPVINRIAVSLDFSNNDEKVIAYALAQGKQSAHYVLMHIVETASASYLGESTDDYETRKDLERLGLYADQLQKLGFTVTTHLGYRNRVNEIIRIVKEENAHMLIMGAHRHTGLKDLLYGQTVDAVRHKLSIPLLIVS